LIDFENPELKAGILLLKIIRDNWEEFVNGWQKIRELLNSMEESKKIDLEEDMLDYIFRSRLESRELVEEVIMGKQKTMTLYERALEEGIEQGIEQGIEKGIEKGIEQGMERGRLEGEFRKALDTAKRPRNHYL
jgi:flagellar biosynthesis/type III secretory pathway protein FliH